MKIWMCKKNYQINDGLFHTHLTNLPQIFEKKYVVDLNSSQGFQYLSSSLYNSKKLYIIGIGFYI